MAHYKLLSASLMVVLLLVIMKSDHTEGGSAEKEIFTCKAERESETCVCSCKGKPSSASGSEEVLGTRKLKAKCRCTCEDVNECQNGFCASEADCVNSVGNYTCTCRAGYEGDGNICSNIDECTTGTGSPCSIDATCTDNDGSFSCACNANYRGDGRTCTDIDECAENLATCASQASCTNTPGGYTCQCDDGYQGNGMTCAEPSAPVCPDDVIKGTDLAGTPVPVSWTYPEANNMTNVFPLVSSHVNGTTFLVGKTIVNISLENFPSLYCNFSVTVLLAAPLGLESHTIPDSSLSASSEGYTNWGARRGRLNAIKGADGGGAWYASEQDANQWIQVDLGSPYQVTAVATQGNQDAPHWVTSYKVTYSLDGVSFDTVTVNGVDVVFAANTDEETVVRNTLPAPVLCRYVRILPVAWHGYIYLRMELYGTVPVLAYYPFEGDVTDSSGNNRHGVTSGTVTYSPGKCDNAASFNGASKVTVEDFVDFAWGSEFSVSVWFKRTGQWGNVQGIVNNGYYKTGSWEIRMGGGNSGQMLGGGILTLQEDDLMWDYSNLVAAQNTWNHVVMTYDGTALRYYLNGGQQPLSSQIHDSPILTRNTPVTIGQAGQGTSTEFGFFYGLIDEVKIYSRVLSAEYVQNMFNHPCL